jgi:DNA repair protein RadC
MPKLSPPQPPRRPRTSAVASPPPDLFGDAPGVGEMTARYAGSSRPDGSADVLRARVRAGGLDRLNDAETLELLLSRSMACGAKAHAAALLGRFGCLRRVLAADIASLSAIVDAGVAIDLQLIYDATRRLAAAELPARFGVSSWSALFSYLKLTMAHCEREAFRVLFLDKKNQLIADEIMNEGTVDHAPVYPREVMRRSLELSASALILVHNHPSGDQTPSAADVEMTRRIVDGGRALGIAVHDHVVVGRAEVASFKALGLM